MAPEAIAARFIATGTDITDLLDEKPFEALVPLWYKLNFDTSFLTAVLDKLVALEQSLGRAPSITESRPLFAELGILSGTPERPGTTWTRGGFLFISLIASHYIAERERLASHYTTATQH